MPFECISLLLPLEFALNTDALGPGEFSYDVLRGLLFNFFPFTPSFFKLGLGLLVSDSLVYLLQLQILGSQLSPTESEYLGI